MVRPVVGPCTSWRLTALPATMPLGADLPPGAGKAANEGQAKRGPVAWSGLRRVCVSIAHTVANFRWTGAAVEPGG